MDKIHPISVNYGKTGLLPNVYYTAYNALTGAVVVARSNADLVEDPAGTYYLPDGLTWETDLHVRVLWDRNDGNPALRWEVDYPSETEIIDAASAATAAQTAAEDALNAATGAAAAGGAAATAAAAAQTSAAAAVSRLGAFTGAGNDTVRGAIRSLGAAAAGLTDATTWGGTGFDNTQHSLQSLRSRGDSAWIKSSGGGALLFTLTVNDESDNPVEAADVSLVGNTTYSNATDDDGIALFSVEAGDYIIVVSKAGYDFPATPITINANGSVTVSAESFTPPPTSVDPNTAIAFLDCYLNGDPEAGVYLFYQLIKPPPGNNLSFNIDKQTSEPSDEAGRLTVEVLRNSTYDFWRGEGEHKRVVVGNSSSVNLPQILGRNNA